MATLNKFFKGILQYKSTDNFTKEPGYIYFVRNVGSDDAEVYFGTRKYGEVNASKLTELQNLISDNTQSIAAIAGKVGDWVNNTATIAQAVIEVSGATQTNAEEITKKVDTTAYTAYTAATETTISNAKNAAISASTGNTQTQIQALDSRVSGAALEERITIEVAQENGKLSQLTLTASNIAKNTVLTAHTSNTDIHVTTEDKTKWNKVDEKVDTTVYTAYTGETKAVIDQIKEDLSAITNGAVTSVTSTGKTVTVTESEGAVNVEVNTLSVASAQANGYIALEHGTDGALYGVMYYGGDDAE